MTSAETHATGPSRREQRRLEHEELSRNQILDAAEEVFGRKSYHLTTLKEIAERGEFSVGSVYSFFDGKEDLYAKIFVRRGGVFLRGMRAALERDDAPVQQLHNLAEYQVLFFRRHPAFARLLLRTSGIAVLHPEPSRDDTSVRQGYDYAMDMQAGVFRRGQERGELRSGDPGVLARMFSGLVASYQATDPSVVDDDGSGERFALSDFHALLDDTFAVRA